MPPHPSYGAVPTKDLEEAVEEDHLEDIPEEEEEGERYFFNAAHAYSERISERFTPLVRTVSEGFTTLTHPSFRLSEQAKDLEEDRRKNFRSAGTSTIASEMANLSKNTIGGGVMSLSGGIALYASSPYAVISATYWILALGFLFGYFCWVTGRSCEVSLSATYRECWERTVGGTKGGICVAIATTADPVMGLFANSAILSQSLRFVLRGIGIELNIPQCLLLIAVFVLLPLCLMKNLDALAPFSACGMSAVFTALGCMVVRYLDGSYLPGGEFYNQIPADDRPAFGTESHPFSFSIMPFVCMVFTSFDMHYNSPRFYTELKDASVPRFAAVCGSSFGIVSFLYWSIAVVGYATFGASSDSFILNNYAPDDILGTIARICMGFSAVLTYPLNFMGLRDNLLDLLGVTDKFDTEGKLRVFIVFLLTICIVMACFITDLGLISSVGGGTSVALVAFVFPAIMFMQAKQKHGDGSAKERAEVLFVMISMISMAVVGITGAISSVALGA